MCRYIRDSAVGRCGNGVLGLFLPEGLQDKRTSQDILDTPVTGTGKAPGPLALQSSCVSGQSGVDLLSGQLLQEGWQKLTIGQMGDILNAGGCDVTNVGRTAVCWLT